MSCEEAQISIEYTKWLIRSLDYVANGIDYYDNKFQNAIAIISDMLNKNLVKDYDYLLSWSKDFDIKVFKDQSSIAKDKAYEIYRSKCDNLRKCFHMDMIPDLKWEGVEGDTKEDTEEEEQQFTVESARLVAYDTLQLWQKRVIALHMAVNNTGHQTSIVLEAKNILHDEIYKQINHAYGIYFMFALGGDSVNIKTAKQIAYHRYFSSHMSIMGYQETDFTRPGSFYAKDEETFKKDIKKHFLT